MRRDGVALVLAVLVPVIAFAILTLTFSNAVIRNLRVAIVDADRSATSLIYVQSIASAPGVTVAERSSDMRSAMEAVRSGDAIAAVYIPENFERDLLARKRPQVVSLYNRQYFTPGNNAASSISMAKSGACLESATFFVRKSTISLSVVLGSSSSGHSPTSSF